MNIKKICIVSPSLKMGGIERALTVLANYFTTKGHDIIFISCLSGDKFYSLNENVRLVEPNFKNTGGIQKIFFYIKLLFFLRREIKKAAPDVVLSFGDWFNPIVLFSLLGLKYPVYISDRTSPDYNFNVFTKIGKKILYPNSKGFIAQTQKAADFKYKQFGNKLNIKIIPNAIRDIKFFNNEKENCILYVGRFAWEKGPQRLIEAFSTIQDIDEWKLHMAGDGPMLNDMILLSKKLNIENRIVFHGKVQNVDELFSKSKIYVLPSVLEGFPNSLCEALSAGVPSICFETIPFENLINDGENGYVVKNNQELASRIKELILNPEKLKLFSENALKIKENLSIDKVGTIYLEFLFDNKK